MTGLATLRGMTWDHSRGFDPMVATSLRYAELNPGVEILWEKRSLQEFADRPVKEMAASYDLMVIDHPHVGEVSRNGGLLAFDTLGRSGELAELASNSVGSSHRSYEFDGRQWALAIDAATPVAAFRADLISEAPSEWSGVLELAKDGQAAFALIPVNALMTFFGLARNMGFVLAEDPEKLIDRDQGRHILETLAEIAGLMDPACLRLDPIGILDWMGRKSDSPAYSPFGYGYTNYSRDSYCRFPVTFTNAPGMEGNGPRGTVIGGTGIAVSAASEHQGIAADYAFWIAGAECQSGLFFEAGGQPAHAAAWESDACNAVSRNFFRNTRETLETAWLRPRYDGYMGFQERGGNIIHACLSGDARINQALDLLQSTYLESRA
jgi:multiple sugar transport system substrate-binding protein